MTVGGKRQGKNLQNLFGGKFRLSSASFERGTFSPLNLKLSVAGGFRYE